MLHCTPEKNKYLSADNTPTEKGFLSENIQAQVFIYSILRKLFSKPEGNRHRYVNASVFIIIVTTESDKKILSFLKQTLHLKNDVSDRRLIKKGNSYSSCKQLNKKL